MGVSKMFELIKKNAPSAIKPVKITKFSNKIVAIDASMVMYQFVIATRHMTYEPLKDKEGNITR